MPSTILGTDASKTIQMYKADEFIPMTSVNNPCQSLGKISMAVGKWANKKGLQRVMMHKK